MPATPSELPAGPAGKNAGFSEKRWKKWEIEES
jgi:hypothetical protein